MESRKHYIESFPCPNYTEHLGPAPCPICSLPQPDVSPGLERRDAPEQHLLQPVRLAPVYRHQLHSEVRGSPSLAFFTLIHQGPNPKLDMRQKKPEGRRPCQALPCQKPCHSLAPYSRRPEKLPNLGVTPSHSGTSSNQTLGKRAQTKLKDTTCNHKRGLPQPEDLSKVHL